MAEHEEEELSRPVTMALSCIPTPFGGCDLFQEQRLTTTDGVVLELAEVAHGRQLVVITLDMNQATPSAAATLAELFRPLVEANLAHF